jgi:hypothetical protein
MAKTFYKYGERDAISYVDWSQVGRNFTDMVDTEVARTTTLLGILMWRMTLAFHTQRTHRSIC